MKPVLLILGFIGICFGASAQHTGLHPDQNPNYMQSQEKYMKQKDSLLRTANTTVSETYKAYDWYEAKLERKDARRNARWQRNAFNNNFYDYNPYYNNWNRWGYGWNNNPWMYRPTIGFRTGNWFFAF